MRREELGLSQEELAHRLGLKSRSSVTRIEKSGDDITLKDIERLSEALNCSPLYLMGWEDKKKNEQRAREQRFIELYSCLNPSSQELVDNMIKALSEKQ